MCSAFIVPSKIRGQFNYSKNLFNWRKNSFFKTFSFDATFTTYLFYVAPIMTELTIRGNEQERIYDRAFRKFIF